MLNLFSSKISKTVKRQYYYNPDIPPEEFAANMERVNNLSFSTSKDLVWVELPDLEIQIKPKQSQDFLREVETIENDEQLFIKTFYKYLKKLFTDNGYISTRNNLYISLNDKKMLSSNQEVSYHESYQIKLYNLKDNFYLSITPRLTFLSTKPAHESKARSSYLLNTKSGRSFPYISSLDGVLTIQLPDGETKQVRFPENYYFNYTLTEAEKLGFSKEIYRLYKEIIASLYQKIPEKLAFLTQCIGFEKTYTLGDDAKKKITTTYRFKNGTAPVVKEIFRLMPYQNNSSIKIAFFFPSEKTFNEVYPQLKTLFVEKNSIFYRTMHLELGFQKIEYIRDPSTNQSKFFYNEHTFEIEKQSYFENLQEKVFGIIVLDYNYHSIDDLPKHFPNVVLLGPILKAKLQELTTYVIKSYMYKILNFTQEAQAYIIDEIPKDTLFIGIDLSHRATTRESTLLLSAVDNFSKVIHVAQYNRLPLNEKINIDTLEEEIIKSISKYQDKHGQKPQEIYIFRDGIYIENISSISTNLEAENIKHTFVSINKQSNINSQYTLAEHLIKLTENKYIYFPDTINGQTSVEIDITINKTDKTNDEIAKITYLSTKLYHPTPYASLKLPYPLYITDKVGKLPIAWKIYIPYR